MRVIRVSRSPSELPLRRPEGDAQGEHQDRRYGDDRPQPERACESAFTPSDHDDLRAPGTVLVRHRRRRCATVAAPVSSPQRPRQGPSHAACSRLQRRDVGAARCRRRRGTCDAVMKLRSRRWRGTAPRRRSPPARRSGPSGCAPAGGRPAPGPWRTAPAAAGCSTGPGHSALTRMPSRANCTPSSRLIASTPPLDGGVGDLRGRRAHHRHERRGVDDRAAALLAHVRDDRLAAQVDAGQVDLLHPPPGVEAGVQDRVVVGRGDAGVVERDVDAAVGRRRCWRTSRSTCSAR